jgi:hypothetical protein
LFALWTSNVERADLVISDKSAVELKPSTIFRLSGSDKNEGQELQAVTKEVVGIQFLLTHSLFGGDFLRGLSFASASGQ